MPAKSAKKSARSSSKKTSKRKTLSPIGAWLSEGIDLTKKNIGRLFPVWVVSVVAQFALWIGLLLLVIGRVASVSLEMMFTQELEVWLPEVVIAGGKALVVGFFVVSLLAGIVNMIAQIVSLLVLDSSKKSDLLSLLSQKGLKRLLPLIVLQILMMLLVIGGAGLLLIPSVIILFFLSFAAIDLILNEKNTALMAMQRSSAMVKAYFWPIFVRSLVFSLIYIGVFGILPGIFEGISETLSDTLGLFVFFPLGVLFGWYMLSVSLILYRELDKLVPRKEPGVMPFLTIMAILGWVIIAGFGLFVAKNAKSLFNKPYTLDQKKWSQKMKYGADSEKYYMMDEGEVVPEDEMMQVDY